MIISTKVGVDTTIQYLVIEFLLLIHVTLTFDHWPQTPISHGQLLYLSILELQVMMSAISHHWQCICRHCT